MKITIDGTEIRLNDNEVKQARKLAASILNDIERQSEEKELATYYYTFLIVMNVLTKEAIETIDPNKLSTFTTVVEQIREQRNANLAKAKQHQKDIEQKERPSDDDNVNE